MEDYILTFNENDEATLACESGEEVDAAAVLMATARRGVVGGVEVERFTV
jgi:hypothetical protein